jgi:hypothetical protein
MNASSQMPPESWNDNEPPMPDPLRMTMAMDRIMHANVVMLMIKRIIWWVCGGLQTAGIAVMIFLLFHVNSMDCKLLFVAIMVILHEGGVCVFVWVLLTSLRMDLLRELKGMELQLAEFRTDLKGKTRETE